LVVNKAAVLMGISAAAFHFVAIFLFARFSTFAPAQARALQA
jgi:hypothetical protein